MAEVYIKGLVKIGKRLMNIANDVFTQSLKDEIGMFVIFSVQQRMDAGVDAHGKNFKPYSKRYARHREKTGRQTSPVNLTYHGSMRSAMTYETDGDKIRTFFQDTEDQSGLSNAAKAYFLNQDRNFFALSKQDRKNIVEIVKDQIKTVVRG